MKTLVRETIAIVLIATAVAVLAVVLVPHKPASPAPPPPTPSTKPAHPLMLRSLWGRGHCNCHSYPGGWAASVIG
jgi:hypothetical protein